LEQLADRDRALIETCYRAGVKIKNVAEAAGKPTAVIYRRLHRIRESLRQCVQRAMAQEEHA
jgi:DNA-directed RNA polymerase specialized sigma24 family protein